MTDSGDIGKYVGLREKWHLLLVSQETPRTAAKDALYNALTAEWHRMTAHEQRCAGFHCRTVYG